MKLTEFMIDDVFNAYKRADFKKVVLTNYMHDEHKSFLYVSFTMSNDIEIHLTVDASYPAYEHKRPIVPAIVYIFDTLKAVKMACDKLGFLL